MNCQKRKEYIAARPRPAAVRHEFSTNSPRKGDRRGRRCAPKANAREGRRGRPRQYPAAELGEQSRVDHPAAAERSSSSASYFMMRRARDQFDGGILGNFVKSPAKRHDKSKQRTTFDEVAGNRNAKSELRNRRVPQRTPKFQPRRPHSPGSAADRSPRVGQDPASARLPEAGVPFFSISGSEFIQMFVGVGAQPRCRDACSRPPRTAPASSSSTRSTPSSGSRARTPGGGHDEREQTLNQILTEMDGFSPNESVIVLAATNRPDVLDPACSARPIRPARHRRSSDEEGAARDPRIHSRNIPLDADVDLESIARHGWHEREPTWRTWSTSSSNPATREDENQVDMRDFDAAHDKIIMGGWRGDHHREGQAAGPRTASRGMPSSRG